MVPAEPLAILMVVAVVALLMIGYPVALTLAGVSLIFAALGDAAGVMNFTLLGALPQRIFGVMTNEVLLTIPLFVFMGVMLERSRIAEELLETMGRLFGSLTGGLAISATIVGSLLAAAKGVAGATTVTMGLITLPAMMRHGYDPRLAAGTVAATATLAQIMPPATVLVLLADQINIAFQSAQLAAGKFSPDSVSIGDLFAGARVHHWCVFVRRALSPLVVNTIKKLLDLRHGFLLWRLLVVLTYLEQERRYKIFSSHLTTSTSQGAWRTTRAAVEPKSRCSMPVCPICPTTSKVSGSAAASRVSAGLPRATVAEASAIPWIHSWSCFKAPSSIERFIPGL